MSGFNAISENIPKDETFESLKQGDLFFDPGNKYYHMVVQGFGTFDGVAAVNLTQGYWWKPDASRQVRKVQSITIKGT